MAAAAKGPSPSGTLLLDDALTRIIHGGKKGLKIDKKAGLAPKGSHSCFGDFPADYMPRKVGMNTTGGLSRSGSCPGSLMRATTTGFGSSGGLQKAGATTMQDGPPKAGSTRRRPATGSEFRRFYDRGDLPVQVFHGAAVGKIVWKVEIEKLDYHHYLPIFMDGLREKEDPYRLLAVQGVYDMLERGGHRILPVVPQLIIPIKTALNTRDLQIICTVLKVLQALVLSDSMVGEALVPYYRQLLPVFNIFKSRNLNLGDKIDYSQQKRKNLGDLIEETLQLFEVHGGEDAFINIKYMIPVYESCVHS